MATEEFAVVNIENGPVKGIKVQSVLNTDYYSFRGIPYMKAPLGKLRFREAQSPRNWTHPFDATQEGPSYCMTNFMTNVQEGQENAGTINVFTRNLSPKRLLPVMIWVHGGGYCRGSSKTDLYGPDYFIEQDVILVSFNYRLGIIGFLSLNDPSLEIPGNVGLKDQIFALKWVQQNIQKFGGDPKQCTVFGESAGGSSVHFLTITPQTKGLFQRAIIMSGSAFNKTWSLTPRKNQGERLARNLGWKGKKEDESSILEFLENVPAFELDEASYALLSDEEQFCYGMLIAFGPVIEPYDSENCVVAKEPIEMAREAWTNDIDVIVTGTSFEGILRAFVNEEVAVTMLQNPSFFAPLLDLDLDCNDEKALILGKRIKKLYYTEGEEPSLENQLQYLKFNSDIHFWHGVYRIILSRQAHAKGKTYLLYFDIDADLNMFKTLKKCKHLKGASHADDLFYLFTTSYHDRPEPGTKEFESIKRFVGMFTSFAKTGDPNCPEVSMIIQPVGVSPQLKCISITENGISEISLPGEEKFKVWDSVYVDQGVALH